MLRRVILSAIVVAALPSSVRADLVEFILLGDLPGGGVSSEAYAVSGDGLVVVGQSNSVNGNEAYRWTRATGMVGLGDLPGGTFDSMAYGASADGSVVVGRSASSDGGYHAFRWTEQEGMVDLGTLGGIYSSASDVSTDGSVITGYSTTTSGKKQAFRWTATEGMVELGYLSSSGSSAGFLSADGSTIVGTSDSYTFIWTEANGMQALGGDSPLLNVYVNDITSDASMLVGMYTQATTRAYSWTESEGMVFLGDLPGGREWSRANAVSADGSVITGWSGTRFPDATADHYAGFIWDAEHGMRDLTQLLLTEYSLDLPIWSLATPCGISDDGRTIVGHSAGMAWVVTIPEPATLSLLTLGGLMLRKRQQVPTY